MYIMLFWNNENCEKRYINKNVLEYNTAYMGTSPEFVMAYTIA